MRIVSCKLSDARLLFKIHQESVNNKYLNLSNQKHKFKVWEFWLKYKLLDSKSKIFIKKINNYKFGFVKFDHINKKNYEVSIGILSKNYNKGLGTKLLNLSIKKFTSTYRPKKIVCLILKSNKRSEKCFKNNNFILTKFKKKKHKTHNKPNLKKDNYFEYFKA